MAFAKMQMRRDSASDWANENPTLSEGEIGFETDNNRLKIGDGTTAYNDLDYVTSANETSADVALGIGDIFFSNRETVAGSIRFGADAVNKVQYAELYTIIGDRYKPIRVLYGDTSNPGSALFYASPPEGYTPRAAYKKIEFGGSDITGDSITATDHRFLRDGDPVLYIAGDTAVTGLTGDTVYYVIVTSTSTIQLASTETNAIAGTNLSISGGSNDDQTLLNCGMGINDAFQGHWHSVKKKTTSDLIRSVNNSTSGGDIGSTFGAEADDSHIAKEARTDGTNGTPRISNETRPDLLYQYGYVKAEIITPSGDPISALRYSTGWVANSDWTNAEFAVSHSLNTPLSDLMVKFFISTSGGDSNCRELMPQGWDTTLSTGDYGLICYQVSDDEIKIQTGVQGCVYINDAGAQTIIASQSWYYKAVVIKPNLIATYSETSIVVEKDISSASQNYTLPVAEGFTGEVNVFWTGGDGTYTFTPIAPDNATIGGKAASEWLGTLNGRLTLISNDSNWLVKEYVDCDLDWHYVGDSGEPAFLNGWVNFGGSFVSTRFRKEAGGNVQVQIMAKSGTDYSVFALPVGYRPTHVIAGAGIKEGYAGCWWYVSNNGNFDFYGYSATRTGAVFCFKAEQ